VRIEASILRRRFWFNPQNLLALAPAQDSNRTALPSESRVLMVTPYRCLRSAYEPARAHRCDTTGSKVIQEADLNVAPELTETTAHGCLPIMSGKSLIGCRWPWRNSYTQHQTASWRISSEPLALPWIANFYQNGSSSPGRRPEKRFCQGVQN